MAWHSIHTIFRQLRALGVESGDHLGLGISFKSIGKVHGGPKTFVEALLEAVGRNGTLLIPSYTPTYPLSWARSRPMETLFQPHRTPAYTGLIPELMRQRDDALRSRHPTNSIVAIGRLAEHFTASHDESAPAYSPYSTLAASGGKVITIGIDDRIVGLRHQAQYLAGLLTQVPFQMGATYLDGSGCLRVFERKDMGGCTVRLIALTKQMRAEGLVIDGHVGNAEALIVNARPALEYLSSRLKEHPTINLCSSFWCIWCRELERRMGLFERIESPRAFQSNKLIIASLELLNRLRLNQPYWLVRVKLLTSSLREKTTLPPAG